MLALDLEETVRPKLVRMEDSIILALFERTQFKTNGKIYKQNAIPIPGWRGSFLDYLLYGTEKLHASVGRYEHHEEHAFFRHLPKLKANRIIEKSPVKKTNINLNAEIKKEYLQVIPKICEKGDDKQYGSATICDINCLQALSRRIHYGEHVAESKFQKDRQGYSKLIKIRDEKGLIEKLTNNEIEKKILQRVKEKGEKYQVNSSYIAKFYETKIIPLTTKVEVTYLLQRLD